MISSYIFDSFNMRCFLGIDCLRRKYVIRRYFDSCFSSYFARGDTRLAPQQKMGFLSKWWG